MRKLRKISLQSRKFTLNSVKGYTLVELLVVMGIIGLLLALTFGGYNGIRKQKYVQHVANMTQTEIRGTFIDVISTKVENSSSSCNGRSPQVKALRVKLKTATTNPIARVALCEGSTTGILEEPPDVLGGDIDASTGLNFRIPVRVQCMKDNGWTGGCPWSAMGHLYFIFTSPYGKYYSYYSSETDPVKANNDFFTFGNPTSAWTQNPNTFIYEPTLSVRTPSSKLNHYFTESPPNLVITFDSKLSIGGSETRHTIKISENGNVLLD